jgi:hypothetical protein
MVLDGTAFHASDMVFDLIQRRGTTDVVTLAEWTHHFDPNPQFDAELYRFEQDALGTDDFQDGDQLIFKYTIDAPSALTCWEPNGDGPSGRDDMTSQIPHFTPPK